MAQALRGSELGGCTPCPLNHLKEVVVPDSSDSTARTLKGKLLPAPCRRNAIPVGGKADVSKLDPGSQLRVRFLASPELPRQREGP